MAQAGVGRAAAHHASRNGYVEIVKLLLAAGVKKDKINTDGKTALSLATQWGHHDIVQLLQPVALEDSSDRV